MGRPWAVRIIDLHEDQIHHLTPHNGVGNLQFFTLKKSHTNSFLTPWNKRVVFITYLHPIFWASCSLSWKNENVYGKDWQAWFFFFLPWFKNPGMTWRRGCLQIGIMDHISVTPHSKLTQKLWASPLPLGCCTCGWTTGHALSCRQLDHKADLAVSFEDISVLKNLRLNGVAHQQHVLWIPHFGSKLKIAGISSNCIICVHIKALIWGRYIWEWSANMCEGYS